MLKRIFDLVLTIPGTLVILPFLLILAFLVRIFHGRPLLFSQVRPGLDGNPFRLYKFRTMTDACDDSGHLLPDIERMTSLGRVLRSTSLDELPTLWNVIKGDMSLVGPRPLLMEYLPLYSPEQNRRHDVWPGMTGWAQVNGRNAISWEDKFKFDVWYIENWSLWLDIKILWITFIKVFKREGISQEGHPTMEPFRGNTDK
ncbi:MAG: sugar transferase [Chlorobiaceae bacterium]